VCFNVMTGCGWTITNWAPGFCKSSQHSSVDVRRASDRDFHYGDHTMLEEVLYAIRHWDGRVYHGHPLREHRFWVYHPHKQLKSPRWDTHSEAQCVCNNSTLIFERRDSKEYKCHGHEHVPAPVMTVSIWDCVGVLPSSPFAQDKLGNSPQLRHQSGASVQGSDQEQESVAGGLTLYKTQGLGSQRVSQDEPQQRMRKQVAACACGHENRVTAKFCEECGLRLNSKASIEQLTARSRSSHRILTKDSRQQRQEDKSSDDVEITGFNLPLCQ